MWLDKDASYTRFVDELAARHALGGFPFPVVGFRGSFLELLFQLEPFGSGLDRQPLLIRMPGFRRPGPAVQLDGSAARWWTFAGGRVNHTLKYGLEVAEGWKVVVDNFQLRIEGDGIGHESVRRAIERMSTSAFWDAPELRLAVLARLPGYRLSKFQDCLPERFALEVIERYLLDVEGTVRWLGGGP